MNPMISILSWFARTTAPWMVALSAGVSPPAVRIPMRFMNALLNRLLTTSASAMHLPDMRLTQPIDNPGLIEIVRRHLELDPVAGGQADETLSHLSGNVGEHEMVICKFDSEH